MQQQQPGQWSLPNETLAGPSHGNWQQEFERFRNQPNYDFAAFESVYQGPQEWTQEFHSKIQELPDHAEANQEWDKQFEKIQNAMQSTSLKESDWNEEFAKYQNVEQSDQEWAEKFNQVWNDVEKTRLGNDDFIEWDKDFDEWFPNKGNLESIDPTSELYTFEKVNPFLELENPLEQGLKIMQEQGSLSQAALAFEAAVQKNPFDAEAWRHLGQTQMENEKEIPAIIAFQTCIQLNPQDTEAMMSLAVSYTNEDLEEKAYDILNKWISIQYPKLVEGEPVEALAALNPQDQHERLTHLYLQAAQTVNPSQMDANVQVGLGLLFYSVQAYEKSVDCFTAALSVRPRDYLLWNRLGATLANSGSSKFI